MAEDPPMGQVAGKPDQLGRFFALDLLEGRVDVGCRESWRASHQEVGLYFLAFGEVLILLACLLLNHAKVLVDEAVLVSVLHLL